MKSFNYFLLIVCFFLSTKPLIGQQDSSLIHREEDDQVLFFDDTMSNNGDVTIPYTIMMQQGYIINYFYKKEEFYNYNIIFVPASELTNPLIQNIIEKSKVINKGRPIWEHYLLSEKDTSVFESIFEFSWVVKHYMGEKEDSLCKLMGYNIMNSNLLSSEYCQVPTATLESKIPDSIRIVFKLLKVEGIFKLESYNINSQIIHYDRVSSWQHGLKDHLYFTVYGKDVGLLPDYRFISPVFAQVLAIEFMDKKWRKKASSMLRRIKKMKRMYLKEYLKERAKSQ